jgi:hypothetical protein
MDKEKFDLRSEYITKAAQARVAMWSAVGNVFGFRPAGEPQKLPEKAEEG